MNKIIKVTPIDDLALSQNLQIVREALEAKPYTVHHIWTGNDYIDLTLELESVSSFTLHLIARADNGFYFTVEFDDDSVNEMQDYEDIYDAEEDIHTAVQVAYENETSFGYRG